jgi:hypothetical protein
MQVSETILDDPDEVTVSEVSPPSQSAHPPWEFVAKLAERKV